MSVVSEWFEVEEKEEPKTNGAETLKDKLKNDTGDKGQKEPVKKEPEKVAVALEVDVPNVADTATSKPQAELIPSEEYNPVHYSLDSANIAQTETHAKQLLSELESAFPADKDGIFQAFGGEELLAKLSEAGKGALKDKIKKLV